MFASQLLRILQSSIPSDVKYETCVFDPDEQETTMKEKHNPSLYNAKQFGREADYHLAMENEEIYQLNGSRTDTIPVAFDVKAGDGCWNPFMDDSSVVEDDAYKLSSETNNKELREHECSMEVDEFTHHSEKDQSRDSSSSCVAASDLSEKETNMFTDKNVLDCELPEFTVCYKEINYHIVKDICVDEGLPVKEKSVLGNYKHEESIFKPRENNPFVATEGGVDMECFISEELATSSLDDNKGKIEIKEGTGNLNPKLSPESCLEKDSAEHTASEDSMQQVGETKNDATGYDVSDASKEESFIDKTLPIQEFGTRSFLRSFMRSLDFEEHRVDQPPDQIPSGKAVSGIPATSSTETESNEDAQATTSLLNESKVENGSTTFNFNSNPPVVDYRTEHVNELSVGSENLHDHECAISDSLSEAKQVELTSDNDNCKENSHAQQSMNLTNEEKIDDSSPATQIQPISENELIHEHISGVKIGNSDDLSIGDQNSHENDGKAVEPNKHEPDLKHDEGEASFSAASLITYSGPIAYSGSVSIRSDGSAASGRSFAFPVLQNEWNSSPVRMAKANRRDFRKHKGWRLGLPCCRF